MKILAALLAALVIAFPVHAKPAKPVTGVWQGMKVTLLDKPCKHEEISLLLMMNGLPPQAFKAGTVVEKGKTYALCWAKGDDRYLIVDETGAGGSVPLAVFDPKAPKVEQKPKGTLI